MMLVQASTLAVRQQPILGMRRKRKGAFRTDKNEKVYNKLRKRVQRAA